ncbi:MAG TPA: ubiquitin-like domain-containing protein [Mycobacteriales bacterium]|nr:ubiquitin-like domain-containing protein [Mycobacteriales bacterium]
MSYRTTLLARLRDGVPGPVSGAAAVLRRPAVLVVQALVLLALLAGTVAWTLTGTTVALAVDGEVQEVDLRGGTVADVLEAADLTVGEHDSLVPSADTPVEDGDRVVLRRGRPLTLTVDGEERTVWVTALSVEEALGQLDLRQSGLFLSASRSRSIPLDGLSLDIRTPKALKIVADGQTRPVTSAAANVGAAVAEAGITLGQHDRVTPGAAAPLTPGLTILVQRVKIEQVTEQVAVPAPVERREDPDLAKGTTRVIEAGSAGLARRTTEVTYVDGTVESRKVVAEQRLREPTTRIVAVGTKAVTTSSGPRQSTGDVDSLNWAALANCESGGNPRAVSSTGKYRGLYQFSMTTWQSVGGQGDPIDNSAAEQTYRAKILYKRSGAGQWPHCGKYLFT